MNRLRTDQIQQKRWLLDAALFTGFLVCFFLELTGVALHQWLGVAAGMAAIYHLAMHWNWVSAVTSRFFGKTSPQARWYYLIDAALLAGFAAIIGTGLVISTWLNLTLAGYSAWYAIHVVASISTLLLVTLKIGLHGRWILSVWKKWFNAPAVNAQIGAQPAAAGSVGGDRRDFLRLMGAVGAASVLALSSSLKGLADTTDAAQASNTSTTTSTGTTRRQSSNNSASGCVLRCNKQCSYPGRCRRYQDSNGNGRCDLGECQS